MNKVLIVGAHPDDEILGVGGTAAKLAQQGYQVQPLIVAEGATSRSSGNDIGSKSDAVNLLTQCANRAAEALNIAPPQILGLPDNRLDSLDLLDVIKPIEAICEELKPNIVYTHHSGDLNLDHRIVHQAVITACRSLPGSTVKAIYAFETLSSTEWGSQTDTFRPTRFVDISETLEKKITALTHYEPEMREFPHPRSLAAVEHNARLRGAYCGCLAAEAFEVVLEIC
jgi:N-acetylglucosamine malate deacetylase 1